MGGEAGITFLIGKCKFPELATVGDTSCLSQGKGSQAPCLEAGTPRGEELKWDRLDIQRPVPLNRQH